MRFARKALLAGILLVAVTAVSFGHCQVPCGIYTDQMRFDMIAEHITTLEKAMNQIEMLSDNDDKNYNQIVRWVVNKEEHADKLGTIVTEYFMRQRVKMPDKGDDEAMKRYDEMLRVLHAMLVSSMKAKQTTDQDHIKALKKQLDEFHELYFHGKDVDKSHYHRYEPSDSPHSHGDGKMHSH
ncbi:superoxide dismutase [bacterium]|nr:superoxide dismutase [bacterium]